MNFLGVLWAIVGALLGASLWTGITYATGYQIGWMAIAVGAMVGMGARMGGGEGNAMALFCGGLTLVAMFIGEVMTVQVQLDKMVDELVGEAATREFYEAEFAAADQFALYTPEASYPAFILEHTDISEADSPENVTDEDMQIFLELVVPELRWLHEERPTYEVWIERNKEYAKENLMAGVDISGYIIENFGLMDAVFAFLGLTAAMRIVGEWE